MDFVVRNSPNAESKFVPLVRNEDALVPSEPREVVETLRLLERENQRNPDSESTSSYETLALRCWCFYLFLF
jgi:hypothetical protein